MNLGRTVAAMLLLDRHATWFPKLKFHETVEESLHEL
jgi:hypothetical protein